MSILKQMAMTPALNELVKNMCPPNKPDAKAVEYQFHKCPKELRGEVIVSMAKVDGFIIGLERGSDITMYTDTSDSEMGDRWFEVVQAHHADVLWHLMCLAETPKVLH